MSSHLIDDSQNSEEHHTVLPVVSCWTASDDCHALPLNLQVYPEGIGLRSSRLPSPCNNMTEVTGGNHTLLAKQPEIYWISVRNYLSFSNCSKRMLTHNSGSAFSPYVAPASSTAGIFLFGNIPLNPFAPHKVGEFPVGPSLFMDTNDIQHTNAEVATWEGVSPLAVNNPHLCLGSNQSASSQDLAFTSLTQGPSPYCGAGLFNTRDFITYARNKRPHLGFTTGNVDALNVHKRPKISSCQPEKSEKPHKRELLLFKDVDASSPVSKISFDSKVKNQPDLDPDLHL